MELVELIYRLTRDFPKDELYGLTSQIDPSEYRIDEASGLDGRLIDHPHRTHAHRRHSRQARHRVGERDGIGAVYSEVNWRRLISCDSSRQR